MTSRALKTIPHSSSQHLSDLRGISHAIGSELGVCADRSDWKILTFLAALTLSVTVIAAEEQRPENRAEIAGGIPAENAPVKDFNAQTQMEVLPQEIGLFANRSGFCILLDSGDGKRALELVQKTRYYVFAIA
jgi:hypothetical protein